MLSANLSPHLEFTPIPVTIKNSELARKVYGKFGFDTLSYYNPSSAILVDGDHFIFLRVEPFPYSGKYSSVWLAKLDWCESNIVLELLKPCTNISQDANFEDPWIGRIGDNTYLSIVVSNENYKQVIFRISNDFFTNSNLLQEEVISLPMGLKGLRFYELNDYIVIFTRPQGSYRLVQGSEYVPGDLGKLGYKIYPKTCDLVSALQNAYSEPAKLLLNPKIGWVGVNEYIPEIQLLIYHDAENKDGCKKKYTGVVRLCNLAADGTLMLGGFIIKFELDHLGVAFESLYPPDHELYDIVYPSGYAWASDGSLCILCGVSDCNIVAIKTNVKLPT